MTSSLKTAAALTSERPVEKSVLSFLYRPVFWFWVILLLIVAFGAVPRVLSYDYGLPYMEYVDELRLYMFAQVNRGLYNRPEYGVNYPPGFIKIHEVVQPLMEAQGLNGAAITIQLLRQAMVVTNLLGIVMVALLARVVGGEIAGVGAASVWALSPEMVAESVHAIGESVGYTLMVLNVLCAIVALQDKRRWYWAVGSLLIGGVMFSFDYRLILALIPGALVLLLHIVRGKSWSRRQWLMLAAGVVIAGIMLVLVGIAIIPQNAIQRLAGPALANLFDFPVVLLYMRTAAGYINGGAFGPVVLAGIAAYGVARRRDLPRVNGVGLALPVLMFFILTWISSTVRLYPLDATEPLPRHLLPATTLAAVILGAAVAQILVVIPNRVFKGVVLIAILGLALLPQIPRLQRLVADRQVEIWHVVIRQWADVNVPAGTVIVYRVHKDTFNSIWGGIQGRQWFDWWITEDILEYPLEEWVEERFMTYALLPTSVPIALEQTPAGRDLLANMLRLRDFVHPPTRRTPEGIFYRLWRMEHELAVHFGDQIILTGYDQNPEAELQPGGRVEFTLYWNAPTTPDDNYQLFMHLVPLDEYDVLAQHDSSPAVPERLTLTWDEPSETLISPAFALDIPADLPPGDYRVMMGLYKFETGVRLPVGAGDAYELARIHIP